MRREVSDLVAVFMPQEIESDQALLVRLNREKKEWEIAAYVMFGLFLLLWLSRR